MVLFAVPEGALDPSAVPVAVFEGGKAEFLVEGAGKMLALAVAASVGDGGEVEVRVLEELDGLELVPFGDEGVDAHACEDADGAAEVAAGDVELLGEVFAPEAGGVVQEG